MKWLGQYIQSFTARFRNDVYLENLSTTTETSVLLVDGDGKVSKGVLEDLVESTIDTVGELTIDTDRSAAQGNAGAENITGLHVDFDRTVPSTGTHAHNDRGIDLDVTSASLGTSSLYGIDIDVVGATSGTSTATGIHLDVDGADTNIGMVINTAGTHLKLEANADVDDYATFTVADTGDLTIATTGDGTRDSDFTLDVDGGITLDSASGVLDIAAATITMASETVSSPHVVLECTNTDGESSSILTFKKNGADTEDTEQLGAIFFQGEDEGNNNTSFASIVANISESDETDEAGKLTLNVAESDGTNTALSPGLILEGEHATDGQVDVTIANGASSTTTVAGDLTISGEQLIFASSKGRRACFELSGYTTADGTNYDYSGILSGNKAPFLHDVSIGSDGLTADNPAAFLRANGVVMPYAGALKMWKGWAASAGSGTIDIGVFKYTPTADDATNASLVLVKNTQFTAAGNDNLLAFSETSFSVTVAAGDILITAMKGSTNNKTAYFVSTLEIEWTS